MVGEGAGCHDLIQGLHPATHAAAEEAYRPITTEEDAVGTEGIEAVIHYRCEVFGTPLFRWHEGDDAADLAHHTGLCGHGINATLPAIGGATAFHVGAELGIEGLGIAVATVVEDEMGLRALLDELYGIVQFRGAHGEFEVEAVFAERLHAAYEVGAQAEACGCRGTMQHLAQAFDDAVARVALHVALKIRGCGPPANGGSDGGCVAGADLRHDGVGFFDVIARSHIDLHVDGLHLQAVGRFDILGGEEIMLQHFWRGFDPGWIHEATAPEMLMRVDDQLVRPLGGRGAGGCGEDRGGGGVEELTAVHGER